MRLAHKVSNLTSTLTKLRTETLLYLSLSLIGVPTCLSVLYLLLFPSSSEPLTGFTHAERWIEPLSGYSFDSASFQALSKVAPDFSMSEWTSAPLPDAKALPAISVMPDDTMARLWIRVRYMPSSAHKSTEPLAIYNTRIMGGAYAVWVNGKMVHANIDGWRMQWNKPLLVKLAAQNVTAGQPADIMIAVPFRTSMGYAFGSLYAGPVSAIQYIYDMRFLLEDTLPRGGILVALLLGLFSLQFWLVRRSETSHLLLTLASIAWFICNLQYFVDFDNDLTASRWFGALVDAAVSWSMLLSFLFAFRIAGKEFPRIEKVLVLYALAVTVITLPCWQWNVSGFVLQHYGNLAMGFGLAILFSQVALRDPRGDIKILAVALWTMVLFGTHDLVLVSSQRDPDGIHWFPYTTFLLFGSFMFSVQRRYIEALNNVKTLNASLDERLRVREAELEIKHRQLREAEQREAILAERARMMRGMHDGVGSILISSLVLAKQKRLPPERLTDVLRECTDELRLVIDALDPFEQDLEAALISVRERIGQRIEEAGIHTEWEMDDLPSLLWFDQSHALEVQRIAQEILTNVLKHAQASKIWVSASRVEAASGMPMVLIRISDNGVGFEPANKTSGRGLTNMRQRAQRLHAELAIKAGKGLGASVELLLPVHINGTDVKQYPLPA